MACQSLWALENCGARELRAASRFSTSWTFTSGVWTAELAKVVAPSTGRRQLCALWTGQGSETVMHLLLDSLSVQCVHSSRWRPDIGCFHPWASATPARDPGDVFGGLVLVDPMQAGDPGHASKGLQCYSSARIMVHHCTGRKRNMRV